MPQLGGVMPVGLSGIDCAATADIDRPPISVFSLLSVDFIEMDHELRQDLGCVMPLLPSHGSILLLL